MSIPLDRLYHYIESVAQDVYGDTIIYHFYPHGSKKTEDLNPIRYYPEMELLTKPQIFCNDQEPLNFEMYQNYRHFAVPKHLLNKNTQPYFELNFRKNTFNIFDQCILLHSEKNSDDIEKYNRAGFIPTYYWSHGLISRDWFRYAQYTKNYNHNQRKTNFLIYNRAWSGTREYRLKFAELLIKHNLINECQTSLKFTDDNGTHYSEHNYHNLCWKPDINLEHYYKENISTSCYSADFNESDYQKTFCEVVLETLFDTTKVHLTEKTLRPIALGHPFILCGPPGSLSYLHSYGFKTFNSIIDESYDQIINPVERLYKIIEIMQTISQWTPEEKRKNFAKIKNTVNFNKKYFFSNKFFNLLTDELKNNLANSINYLVDSNTYNRCIELNQLTSVDSGFLNWQSQYIKPNMIEFHSMAFKTATSLKMQNKY